jgi:hypothetical protein
MPPRRTALATPTRAITCALATCALSAGCERAETGPEPTQEAKPASSPRRAYRHVGPSPLEGLALEDAAARVLDAFSTKINPYYALGGVFHDNGPITVRLSGTFRGEVDLEEVFDDPLDLLACLKDPSITRSSWGPPRHFGPECTAPRTFASLIDTPRRFNSPEVDGCHPEGDLSCCTPGPHKYADGSLMLRQVCMRQGEDARWRIARFDLHGTW